MFGLGKKLTPMDPKEYGYQRPPYFIWCRCGLSHDVRVMVPWGGCVPSLMVTIWMHHFQGEFGGRTTLVWRTKELPSSVLVSISNYRLYLHAFHDSSIYSMFWFIDYYDYAMFIRIVIYMFSYLRHPCLIWIYIYVFSLCFLN